ncbi:MAG: DMT family transporter [Clostridium sp.]|nr:DMT family transporter [Clostridium sp.]
MEVFFKKDINILLLAVLCTFLWGSAFPGVKIGYKLFDIESTNTFSQLLFAGMRFTLAGILTIIVCCVMNKKLTYPNKKNITGIGILGIIQTTIQYIFYYIGMANTTGVKGSIINSLAPFIVIIICHIITTDDKLNSQKIIGCILGFLGVVTINLGGSTLDGSFSFFGEGFIILSTSSFAIGSIYSKKICKNEDPIMITGYQLLIGGLVLILVSFLNGIPVIDVNVKALILLLYLALLSSVAFTIWTMLLKYNSAGKVSIYNFLIPIFGTFLSGIFLNESIFNLKNLIALCLVSSGILVITKIKK